MIAVTGTSGTVYLQRLLGQNDAARPRASTRIEEEIPTERLRLQNLTLEIVERR
jgi:hypothetical protein